MNTQDTAILTIAHQVKERNIYDELTAIANEIGIGVHEMRWDFEDYRKDRDLPTFGATSIVFFTEDGQVIDTEQIVEANENIYDMVLDLDRDSLYLQQRTTWARGQRPAVNYSPLCAQIEQDYQALMVKAEGFVEGIAFLQAKLEAPRQLDDYAVVRENAAMVKRLLKRDNRESAFDYDSVLKSCADKLRETLAERVSIGEPVTVAGAWHIGMTPDEIRDDIVYAAAANLKFSDMLRIVASKTGIQWRVQSGIDETTPFECLKWAITEQLQADLKPILAEFAPETD